MPELAAVYALGVLISLSFTAFMTWTSRRRRSSDAIKTLNLNPAKIRLFWSDHKDSLAEWSESSEEAERRALVRTFVLTGSLFSLMSWLGGFFLLILFFSLRRLARSQLERRLLSGALARDTSLGADEVERLVNEAKLP